MVRPPLPPFTPSTAVEKVRAAENAWNSRSPASVALAYTSDTRWRNRSEFLSGRTEVEAFLARKWEKETEYRLIKELWAFTDARIAVRFVYEFRDSAGQWWRCHGNENWRFAPDGLMAERHASINDVAIGADERLFLWPLGMRPLDHPGLSELGL
ncbi:nuclear transport factor 2 family protein [Alsobacter sp. KACC 23698]|uniref:Nuclear transport factor 2 family protein n=1 Tax=Alsobacter sp. KACC 23698 TaxID=3149229 RepID=A0AAU7JNR2_9HYPH